MLAAPLLRMQWNIDCTHTKKKIQTHASLLSRLIREITNRADVRIWKGCTNLNVPSPLTKPLLGPKYEARMRATGTVLIRYLHDCVYCK